MVYFNINQLFISILLFAGLNQAFEPRCRTWPKNQNGTIITKDGAFYIQCEYQGTSPDRHECQFRHFDKKQNFERVYTSNAIGDVIRIDFGNPWEDALYMNFHIMKKETSKNSYPNVRSCNIRAVPSILSQNPKINDDRISLDIIAGYNDNLVS